jgi:hypothetical protein
MLSPMEEPPSPQRRRISPVTIIIALVVLAFCAGAVALAVFATTGDDDDSPEATATSEGTPDLAGLARYIQMLTDLGAAFDERIAEIQTQFNEDISAEDDEAARLMLVKQNFFDTTAANETFISGLEDLSPPDIVAPQHEEMVAAGQAYLSALDRAATELEPLEIFDEAQVIILNPEIEELHSAFVDSCSVLINALEDEGGQPVIFC